MITLTVDNRNVYITGALPPVIRRLEGLTSYKVAGSHFAPSFRAKRWDGKEHLLHYSERRGYFAPVGLAIDIATEFRRQGIDYVVANKRRPHHQRVELPWNEALPPARDYQLAAVEAFFAGQLPGLGIAKMPIRSGKTRTAGEMIRRIGLPTVFAVPSQMLLSQTVEVFQGMFPGLDIGVIGDSEYREGFITVATLQSLHRLRGKRSDPGKNNARPMDPRYARLAASTDVFMCDEAHHIRGGGEWYKVPYDFDSIFKAALSATAYLEDEAEAERGIIWLKGVFGPVRIDISASDLVEDGYLMRQNVKMYTVNAPNCHGRSWSNGLRQECITDNPVRNGLIARLARKVARDLRMKILIIANRLDHIGRICAALTDHGVTYRTITARNRGKARQKLLRGLLAGHYQVLIGTVLGEGVDIPEVECVINAEGGKDAKATVQRQRNLTMAEGKRMALFIDFMDDTNEYFLEHSIARLAAYQAEAAFRVDVVE